MNIKDMFSAKTTQMNLIATRIEKCDINILQAGQQRAEVVQISAIIANIRQQINQCYSLLSRHLTFLERDQIFCPMEALGSTKSSIRLFEDELNEFENRVRNLEDFLEESQNNIFNYRHHLKEKLHRTKNAMSPESLILVTVDPPPECLDKIFEAPFLGTEFNQRNFMSRILTLESVLRDLIGDNLVD